MPVLSSPVPVAGVVASHADEPVGGLGTDAFGGGLGWVSHPGYPLGDLCPQRFRGWSEDRGSGVNYFASTLSHINVSTGTATLESVK